ncbi:MAG: chemotaxis protein CheW [Nitrospirota bacterium]|nr:MAG: chemotaxis protein CheW [Nitrospirota bacterium]
MAQYAVFSVGEEEFGVDIFRVVEILNPIKIFTIPDLPEFLAGVINLRGAVIPVLDLRKRFQIESKPDRERIMIVWVGGQRVGLYIDAVREILDFEPDEIGAPPGIFKGFKPEYLVGLGRRGERVIVLLNTDTILTAQEKLALKESKERMEPVLEKGPEEDTRK